MYVYDADDDDLTTEFHEKTKENGPNGTKNFYRTITTATTLLYVRIKVEEEEEDGAYVINRVEREKVG